MTSSDLDQLEAFLKTLFEKCGPLSDVQKAELKKKARQYYEQKISLQAASEKLGDKPLSTYDFIKFLIDNPDIDISTMPGFIPPRDIPDQLADHQPEIYRELPPKKPWE